MKINYVFGVFLVAVLMVAGLAIADDPIYEAEIGMMVPLVHTSAGWLGVVDGTLIGGNPSNYITLTNSETIPTTEGDVYFPSGTKFDCDFEPGYPDPCAAL